MSKLYYRKYRGGSCRLQSWNYAWSAAYFVTINTRHHRHFFGFIEEGEMCLSALGQIVLEEWQRTLELRPDMKLELDAFVIMPNHIHFIIIIGGNEFNEVDFDASHTRSFPYSGNRFGPQRKNLASIVRGFKASITIRAREIDPEFEWQRKYYDRIIRDHRGLELVKRYINNNVQQWKQAS